jgi:hypothetical protein
MRPIANELGLAESPEHRPVLIALCGRTVPDLFNEEGLGKDSPNRPKC